MDGQHAWNSATCAPSTRQQQPSQATTGAGRLGLRVLRRLRGTRIGSTTGRCSKRCWKMFCWISWRENPCRCQIWPVIAGGTRRRTRRTGGGRRRRTGKTCGCEDRGSRNCGWRWRAPKTSCTDVGDTKNDTRNVTEPGSATTRTSEGEEQSSWDWMRPGYIGYLQVSSKYLPPPIFVSYFAFWMFGCCPSLIYLILFKSQPGEWDREPRWGCWDWRGHQISSNHLPESQN